MAAKFEHSFNMHVVQYEDVAKHVDYHCRVLITPSENSYGFRGPPISTPKLTVAADDVTLLLEDLFTIEMNNSALLDLVEPKNGFNRRDYINNLKTNLPLGYSIIIGDEYPPNTLNRKALIVTHGYETNIYILEGEIAETFRSRTNGLHIHPYYIEVVLTPIN